MKCIGPMRHIYFLVLCPVIPDGDASSSHKSQTNTGASLSSFIASLSPSPSWLWCCWHVTDGKKKWLDNVDLLFLIESLIVELIQSFYISFFMMDKSSVNSVRLVHFFTISDKFFALTVLCPLVLFIFFFSCTSSLT